MKKVLSILFICLLCCSCSQYEELNSLSIISNITIEKEKDMYNVVMQEIIPTKKENGVDYIYKYRNSSSKDLEKAIKNITNHSPKKIYLLKVQNVIIGGENKDEIIKDFIKYYKNSKNFNKDCSVVIAKNKLKKVLKVNSDYKYIDSILKNKKQTIKNISKKKKIKVPVLKINNQELIFQEYYYLQV